MFSQEVNGDLSNSIRVKAEIAGSAKEARKYLGELAGAGAAYIVAEVSRGARAGEKAKIMKSCEEIARGRDVSVELRIGDTTEMFRSSPLRAREARELLLDVPYCHAGGRKIALGAVFQLGFACSQDCIFCTSDRMLPEVSCGEILATLDDVVGQGIQHVVFTGGEPTLNRSLGKFISRCRDSGVTEISLYTNGMALASKQYAKKTVDAGMTFALVSLHSASPKTADAITRCRGGYERTVAGIDNLLQLGTMTAVNYVVNAVNFKETPDFVRFMKRRFTGAALNFSYVAPVMKASATTGIVPKFTEAAPYLKEALEICDEYGIDAAGLEPHWGIPPCALDGDARYFPLLAPLGEKLSGFVKAAACAKCRANSACPGVRKFYGELYGLDELKPLKKDKRA
jgi:MoaA/NifB/PqqE/SkfB family radical SAM enzyme